MCTCVNRFFFYITCDVVGDALTELIEVASKGSELFKGGEERIWEMKSHQAILAIVSTKKLSVILLIRVTSFFDF